MAVRMVDSKVSEWTCIRALPFANQIIFASLRMCYTWQLYYLTNYILGGCVSGDYAEEETQNYTYLFNIWRRFISKVPTQTASTTQHAEFPDTLEYWNTPKKCSFLQAPCSRSMDGLMENSVSVHPTSYIYFSPTSLVGMRPTLKWWCACMYIF